jgi:hypothetical protein
LLARQVVDSRRTAVDVPAMLNLEREATRLRLSFGSDDFVIEQLVAIDEFWAPELVGERTANVTP